MSLFFCSVLFYSPFSFSIDFTDPQLEAEHLKAVRLQQQRKLTASDKLAKRWEKKAATADKWPFLEVLTVNQYLRENYSQTKAGLNRLFELAPKAEHGKYHFLFGLVEKVIGNDQASGKAFKKAQALGFSTGSMDLLMSELLRSSDPVLARESLIRASQSSSEPVRIIAGHRYSKQLMAEGELKQGLKKMGGLNSSLKGLEKRTRRQQQILDEQEQILGQLKGAQFVKFVRGGLASKTGDSKSNSLNLRGFAIYNSSMADPQYWSWMGRLQLLKRTDGEGLGASLRSVFTYHFDQFRSPSFALQARPQFSNTSVSGTSSSSHEIPVGGLVEYDVTAEDSLTGKAFLVASGGSGQKSAQRLELHGQWRRFTKTPFFNPSVSLVQMSKLNSEGSSGLRISLLDYIYPEDKVSGALGLIYQSINSIKNTSLTGLAFYNLQQQLRIFGQLEVVTGDTKTTGIELGALWIF